MKLRTYDAQTGLLDGSVAPAGFERSKLDIPTRRNLLMLGLLILGIAVLVSLTISYKIIFISYSVFSIYVFFCFVVLWLDGAWVDREPPPPAKWPSVSLLIPSYNSGHTIFRCIESCKKLRYEGELSISVIDDGSTDGSYEKLMKMQGIQVLRKQKNEGKAAALNSGILQSTADLICCVDSDTYPREDALTHAVRYFQDKKVGAVVLFINTTAPKNFVQSIQEIEYWISFGFFFKTVASIDSLYVTPGPMALYRRQVFQELGGFDEKNLTEDMEIALRMQRHGWKIRTCHTSVVMTEVPSSISALYRQRLRWLRGGIMNMLKYTDMFLNPQHGNLGLFVLPVILGSGFFAALFMFWSLLNFARTWGLQLFPWLSNLPLFASGFISAPNIDPFLVDSSLLFGLISLLLWLFFAFKSFELSKRKPQIGHLPTLIGMVTLYPVFVGIVFLSAYVHEFSGRRYKW